MGAIDFVQAVQLKIDTKIAVDYTFAGRVHDLLTERKIPNSVVFPVFLFLLDVTWWPLICAISFLISTVKHHATTATALTIPVAIVLEDLLGLVSADYIKIVYAALHLGCALAVVACLWGGVSVLGHRRIDGHQHPAIVVAVLACYGLLGVLGWNLSLIVDTPAAPIL